MTAFITDPSHVVQQWDLTACILFVCGPAQNGLSGRDGKKGPKGEKGDQGIELFTSSGVLTVHTDGRLIIFLTTPL